MLDDAKNFAKVEVSTGYDHLATSIVLIAGHGARLPTPPFNLVWWNDTDYKDPADDPDKEIVRCIAISTDTLTVTRAQEGTTATAKNIAGKTYKMLQGYTKWKEDQIKGFPGSYDAGRIAALTEKTTPVGTDLLLIEDSAAANAKKKIQVGNLPAPAVDFFDKFREYINWNSIDGWTKSVPTGASVFLSSPLMGFNSGSSPTIGNTVGIRGGDAYYGFVTTGKKVIVEWIIIQLSSIVNQTTFLHFTQTSVFPPSETISHCGFRITNADIFATNADGTTQKITDTLVDMTTALKMTVLRVELVPGTDCKFYINGVLKVTHTVNLPTVTDLFISISQRADESAQKLLRLYRILIEKEY